MKNPTLILLILSFMGMVGCKETSKTKHRYFEYGTSFTLKSGCKSGSQSTYETDHALSFDEVKKLTQKWIGKDSIVKFNIWYFTEISKGQMYVFSEPFYCDGHHTYADTLHNKLRILNQKSNKY